jgi:hypothetical protein
MQAQGIVMVSVVVLIIAALLARWFTQRSR